MQCSHLVAPCRSHSRHIPTLNPDCNLNCSESLRTALFQSGAKAIHYEDLDNTYHSLALSV